MSPGLRAALTRRPEGAGELAADAVRVVAIACIPIATIGWGALGLVSFTFVAVGLFVPRALHVRPSLDLVFGAVSLVAAWSSVTDLYVTVRWWDIPMHFLLNGLVAVLCVLLLVRVGILDDPRRNRRPALAAVLVTTAFGLGLAVLWEVFEWFARTYVDGGMFVGYEDTIGDFVCGGLGAAVAGAAYPVLAAQPATARVGELGGGEVNGT